MIINVTDETKIRILSYNSYTILRAEKKIVNNEEKIVFFDQRWRSSLSALITNSILQERLLTPTQVKHRFEGSKNKFIQYIKNNQVHYEFEYEKFLCIAQLKKNDQNINEFELTDLWGFRYSNLPDDFICTSLGKVENRKLLDDIARRFGIAAEQLAREAILDRLSNIMRDIEKQNESLEVEIEILKEQQRQLNIDFYKQTIAQFQKRLEGNYHETSGDECWQKWIYNNNWLFGIQYGRPIEKQKVGFEAIPDFLFPTIDGFIDILEIKLPSHKVISKDLSHSGSFNWTLETTKAIGQVVNYLHEIEMNQLQISQKLNRRNFTEPNISVSLIKPRGFILIGRSNDWNELEREAFRKLNHALHEIELLTYDDLIKRGQSLIDLYIQKQKC